MSNQGSRNRHTARVQTSPQEATKISGSRCSRKAKKEQQSNRTRVLVTMNAKVQESQLAVFSHEPTNTGTSKTERTRPSSLHLDSTQHLCSLPATYSQVVDVQAL